MALETAGFAVGVASLLSSFKGAVDGFVFLSDVYHGFDDAAFYAAKLEIEKQRLLVWGNFFGFDDVVECEKLKEQPEVAQSLVLFILKEFADATTDLEKMRAKYGVTLVKTDVKLDKDAYLKLKPKSDLLDKLAERQKEHNSKLKWWKKGFPWVLDLRKFEKLLDRLEYLNDSLERVVPRVDLPLLTQGLASFLVPAHDQSYLQTFQESSHQYLAMCAAARNIKITTNILSKVPEVSWDEISCLTAEKHALHGSSRSFAMYQARGTSDIAEEVIVDWKEPNIDLNMQQRIEVLKRIKGMCIFFRKVSENHEKHFRVLPCVGIVEDPNYEQQHPGHKKYGFVFARPGPDLGQPQSLFQSLIQLSNVPVGDRFRLAQSLASGLLLLHSSKWLHKNICSKNILTFPKKSQDPFDISFLASPYFTGFSYARPDREGEVSMERPGTKALDYYRHPRYDEGHSRYNDIYSLGVVLFEIGHWQSVESMCSSYNLNYISEEEVQAFLKENCRRGRRLRARMGNVYASVVHRCLVGDFGVSKDSKDDGELIRAFWSSVVRELDSCRA